MADAATGEDPAALAARRKADKEKKAAEKAAKAAEKEARQKQREAGAAKKAAGATAAATEDVAVVDAPSVTLRDFIDKEFGELFIGSEVDGGSGRK